MLFRWKHVALRAAERALAEGRIDDAFDRLRDQNVRNAPAARALLEELAALLMARARLAAQAGDYAAVASDVERIEQLGCGNPDAHALGARAKDVLGAQGVEEALRAAALRRAEQAVQDGRLESGRLTVEQVPDPVRREQLQGELDVRQQRAEALLDQALAAAQAGDVHAAVRFWQDACARHGRTQRAGAVGGELARAAERQFFENLDAGRLDRACGVLDAAGPVREWWSAAAECERLAEQVREAARRLTMGDFARLRESLLRLKAARGDAGWLDATLASLGRLSAARDELMTSPLGVLSVSLHGTAGILTSPDVPARHNVAERVRPAAERPRAALRPLLLLIDGCGSFLLLRSSLVRIGRAHASTPVDVPLPAGVQSHHADIVREGESYFVTAHGPVRVNNRPVMRGLLRDGDRLHLGSDVKLVFRRPSDRSETAVLMLGSAIRLPQDVSGVVLLADTCLIGPSQSNHICAREGDSRLVIFDRGGVLVARRGPEGPAEPLAVGQTRDFGDLRVTLKEYDPAGGARV